MGGHNSRDVGGPMPRMAMPTFHIRNVNQDSGKFEFEIPYGSPYLHGPSVTDMNNPDVLELADLWLHRYTNIADGLVALSKYGHLTVEDQHNLRNNLSLVTAHANVENQKRVMRFVNERLLIQNMEAKHNVSANRDGPGHDKAPKVARTWVPPSQSLLTPEPPTTTAEMDQAHGKKAVVNGIRRLLEPLQMYRPSHRTAVGPGGGAYEKHNGGEEDIDGLISATDERAKRERPPNLISDDDLRRIEQLQAEQTARGVEGLNRTLRAMQRR
jgi:hypothetical protein